MRIDTIAGKNGWPAYELTEYAKECFPDFFKDGILGATIDDSKVEELQAGFENYREEKKIAEAQRAKEVASMKKLLAEDMARAEEVARTMPITSSNNFEGYRIVRYGGYVSGDEVVTLSDHWLLDGAETYMNKDNINNAIKQVRQVAIQELKQAAALIDCNAVIALDFDYINIDRSIGNTTITHIILTANGTAVEIEPI